MSLLDFRQMTALVSNITMAEADAEIAQKVLTTPVLNNTKGLRIGQMKWAYTGQGHGHPVSRSPQKP